MKKLIVSLLLLCFLTPLAFAQTEEKVPEEVRTAMEQLRKDMEQLRQDLKIDLSNLDVDLSNLDIDLSGLDQLKEMDWKNHPDFQKGMTYLESEEFKREMESVGEEVKKAMEEVRLEMTKIEKIDWDEINQIIEETMKEVKKEFPNKHREE